MAPEPQTVPVAPPRERSLAEELRAVAQGYHGLVGVMRAMLSERTGERVPGESWPAKG